MTFSPIKRLFKVPFIEIKLAGYPPYKDIHFSMRNSRHKIFYRFMELRHAAIEAMAGRAPYRGAVRLDFVMYAPDFEKKQKFVDYLAGIMDTLDGSHGQTFTYLPIVYEDDCQVVAGESKILNDHHIRYEIKAIFLNDDRNGEQ